MSLETATYISDLNSANPAGGDAKSLGDDHIRLIKQVIQATFPAIAGAVTPSHTAINQGLVPAGTVIHVCMTSAPTGYLKANGAAVSRATYATLFAAIGTTFGVGDGATTFNLPDLRGEFVRGYDDSRGVDAARVFGSAQAGSVEAHTHTYSRAFAGAGASAAIAGSNGETSTATGSYGGTETRPRNVALLACIKT
jgi:microcystin-dependent protein